MNINPIAKVVMHEVGRWSLLYYNASHLQKFDVLGQDDLVNLFESMKHLNVDNVVCRYLTKKCSMWP